jgi:methionyl-tRNA formyltransferase
MKKILCVGYRDWALNIYDRLSESFHDSEIYIIRSYGDYKASFIVEFNPDYILYYGWSWAVSREIVENYKCIMLHPSPLPKYRGGSPIQNQIINNEKKSAVTLFQMNKDLDSGPIFAQQAFSLEGELSEILNKVSTIGYELTLNLLLSDTAPMPQDEKDATVFSRLDSKKSEITLEEIKNKSSEYLYNKIRMLQDPYPKPFIKTSDGKKLYILKSMIED